MKCPECDGAGKIATIYLGVPPEPIAQWTLPCKVCQGSGIIVENNGGKKNGEDDEED